MKVLPIIKKYGIRPQKKLGQNFLVDDTVRQKMCYSLNPQLTDTVLEIGPGCGALTSILVQLVGRLVAIEKDKVCTEVLKQEISSRVDHFELINGSILDFDISRMVPSGKIKVIGNLPYYITTKVLFHLIEHSSVIESAVLTMQKEVAERILAAPGNRTYGRLSVSVRYNARVEKLFDISPGSFFPAPDVTSTVLKFTFFERKKMVNETLFYDVIRALFEQRRKSIVNGLPLVHTCTVSKSEAKEIFEACQIDFNKRAEELMLRDFLNVTKEIEKRYHVKK
jgi:16S rRNA (adenine1518-N6/adenine1519-N6)-dimethyltransferase